MNIIDLTHPYLAGQTAGNPKNHPVVTFNSMAEYETSGFHTSSFLLGSHTGTHMDAQTHFIPEGASIDGVPLNLCMGDITIADFRSFSPGQRVEMEDLKNLPATERMMLVFGWSRFYGTPQYTQNWPHLSLDAAKYLTDSGVRLIATDVMSLDPKARGLANDFTVHKYMLKHGVIFVESLANTHLIDFHENYYFLALPLSLKGLDGAPCRAVLVSRPSQTGR